MTIALHGGYKPSISAVAEHCYATAYKALSDGDLSNARRFFALLVLFAPSDERAWVGLGVTMEREEDWRAAAALYQLGSALAPRSAWCQFARGRALRKLGKLASAERAFDEAEQATSDEGILRAICQERSGS